jgi:hypothetical protein
MVLLAIRDPSLAAKSFALPKAFKGGSARGREKRIFFNML